MPTALVTGTSTGIGAACVARLATAGWTVFAGVRRPEDGDRVKAANPGDVRPVLLDVVDREQMRATLASIQDGSDGRGLDGLVNNAGVGNGGAFEHIDEATWRWVFDVNLFAPVALTQAAMPLLRAAKGRVVHIGSIGGRLSMPGLSPYSASKHALEALAEAQRLEFRRSGSGVRVSLVEPGEVKTAIWDKADGTVDEVERALGPRGRDDYQWLIDGARGFAYQGRHNGVEADQVARAVEHALTARRPKARYLVGRDAQIYGHVLTKLPDRLRDTMVDVGARVFERRGRRLHDS
jgi:NAD(P)-dependent dehydrogenase (short-subunit alcohol dehydrogenase family)